VVTKPDAPRGRGRKIYDSDVKLGAQELGLTCLQPSDPHGSEFLDQLRKLKPDLGIVVSYGVILKPELLALPKHGMINAHASLLPLYRGAAPIQRAIRDGRTETGVTIMRIVEQLDAGDVLLTKPTPIDPKENAGALRDRLADLSGVALLEALALIDSGKAKFTPQDHGLADLRAEGREGARPDRLEAAGQGDRPAGARDDAEARGADAARQQALHRDGGQRRAGPLRHGHSRRPAVVGRRGHPRLHRQGHLPDHAHQARQRPQHDGRRVRARAPHRPRRAVRLMPGARAFAGSVAAGRRFAGSGSVGLGRAGRAR
jgi:folate-dependent phosphoribosylglycinamide formyltransferase PurN